MLRLLSREVQSGKTTELAAFCESARAAGRSVHGVLAVDVEDGDGVRRRHLQLMSTGEVLPFQLNDGRPCPACTGSGCSDVLVDPTLYDEPIVVIGNFVFAERGFKAASRELEEAAEKGADVVVVDEVGPLELRRGEGLRQPLELLLRARQRWESMEIVVVVRESLRDLFIAELGLHAKDIAEF